MPNPSEAPSWMTETKTKLENSSGFIFVCAEYNATIPPALTNLLDYFPPNIFRHKPASIVTYSMGELMSRNSLGQNGGQTSSSSKFFDENQKLI